jgi:hypothetical protein
MDQEKKQLTVFGYGLAVILGLISVHLWRHHQGLSSAHVILFPCIIALVTLTAVRYSLLRPLYTKWMKVAHFIGSVITCVILSVLFYLVFGIAGILLRLLGKDLLDQKIDRECHSYWKTKEEAAFDKNDYARQF